MADLAQPVYLTDAGKKFYYSPASIAWASPESRDLEALLMELRHLGALHKPVSIQAAVDALAEKLAALGPTGSTKRRDCWTAVVANAERLAEWALRSGYVKVETPVVVEPI